MEYRFFPIKYWQSSELKALKSRSQSESYLSHRSLPILCAGCPMEPICRNPPPCTLARYSPYLPLHIVKHLVKLGFNPLEMSLKSPASRLFIRLSQSEPLRLPLSFFLNGREAGDNLGFLLSKNPRFSHRVAPFLGIPPTRYPVPVSTYDAIGYLLGNPEPHPLGSFWLGFQRPETFGKSRNGSESLGNSPLIPRSTSDVNRSETLFPTRNAPNFSENYWAETINEIFQD